MKKNDVLRLSVSQTARNGFGIAKADDGMTVFVRGACAGDTVAAKIIKVTKSYAVSIIDTIIRPSADRSAGGCAVSGKCGGCVFHHITYEAECALKEASVNDAFAHIGKLALRVSVFHPAEKIEHYRNKAVYPVALDGNGRAISGFYAEKSHRLIPHDDCLIGDALFPPIRDAVLAFANENGVAPYDETVGRGVLRGIFLRKSASEGEVLLGLITAKDVFGSAALEDTFIGMMKERFPAVRSVVLNVNRKRSNAVLGDRWRLLAGDGYLYDVLCGKRFRIAPASFWQVNHAQTEVLYGIAARFAALAPGERLLDLYCGTGTVGICLARPDTRLIGVEIVPQAAEDAAYNAAQNDVDAKFLCLDAAGALDDERLRALCPDVITIDPPRKGCGVEAARKIASYGAKRIVYVSCDPETLARDLAAFEEYGYKAQAAEAVDMFPRTGHIETVCLLTHS